MTESYNGYANRETWALCLWLNNDQGLYTVALDTAEAALKQAVETHEASDDSRVIGEALRDLFDSWQQENEADDWYRDMTRDIGSLWRVDWDEVGSHFIPADHGL